MGLCSDAWWLIVVFVAEDQRWWSDFIRAYVLLFAYNWLYE